jgi:hypothetical protein
MKRLLAAACCAVGVSLPVTAVAATTPLPYTDPAAAGSITLCDASGRPLTHGLVATAPFVASAHTDLAAPTAYAVDRATALLYAYQPRQGVDPSAWSGREIGAGSDYTDPSHPTVVLTAADEALRSVTSDYPPQWDGLLQLRVYLGAPGQSVYRARYAALAIRVSGDGTTWDAVDPGTTPCSTGTAVPEEAILGLPTTAPSSTAGGGHVPVTTATGHAAPASSSSGVAAGAPAGGSGASATTTAAAGGDSAPLSSAAAQTAATHHTSSGGNAGTVALIVIAALVVAGGGAAVTRTKTSSRRR